jgi:hypothetical protein
MTVQDMCDMLNQPLATDIESPEFKEFAATEEFMKETVAVRLHTTSEQNAEPIVEVFCNGIPQRFVRGHWIPVRRMFVEVLARAKPFTVRTPEYTDNNGDRTTRIDINTSLRYPFEMRDSNPAGQAWLNRILREA